MNSAELTITRQMPTPCGVCGGTDAIVVDSLMVRCGCGNHRPDPTPVEEDELRA